MQFPKDILLLDFEGMTEPVQIGAVLLDKDTLAEKKTFTSYIWADLHDTVKKVTGISQATLEGAPSQAEVGKRLFDEFGTDVLLSAWVAGFDMPLLYKLLAAAGIDRKQYDYHVFDLWPVAYAHLLRRGYNGSMRSDDMFAAFGAKPRGLHDALEDCRIVAAILRQIAA